MACLARADPPPTRTCFVNPAEQPVSAVQRVKPLGLPQVTPSAVRRPSGRAANGDGAQDLPDDVSKLVQRGSVVDWDGLEQTLHYVLYDQVLTRWYSRCRRTSSL